MTYSTGTISYDNRARVFWFLISLLACLTVVQVYAVSATTHNVAERSALEVEVTELTAEQGALEFAYLELQNHISIDLALAQGMHEVRSPAYASRTNSSSLGFFTLNR